MHTKLHNIFNKLFKSEATSGALLIFSAFLAMIMANSDLASTYFSIIHTQSPFNILFIVNEILMTIFFLDVGLEIKHQVKVGHLSQPKQISLPIIAAIGGVIIPALLFTAINHSNPLALRGWAIPTATDIAFAAGVINLLRKHIPLELKVLLITIAVIDDLIAILIIASFYTESISLLYCTLSLSTIIFLYIMNKNKIHNIIWYLIVGSFLWFFMLKSGIHATLSGVITALAIPMSTRQTIHKKLYFLVTYIILPLFAFTNAGISLQNLSISQISQPITLGVAIGLIFGKQFGVFSFSWIAIKMKIATLPKAISWDLLYGMAILCGIGFTMSIFTGHLAYDNVGIEYILENKLGVLIGSTISAISGYVFLHYISRRRKIKHQSEN